MPSIDPATELLARLEAMPPRSASLLERTLVEEVPISQLTQHLGVDRRALAISLWIAAQSFAHSPAAPGTFGERGEQEALALLEAVEQRTALPPELSRLRSHAAEILALIDTRHQRHARWEGWARASLALLLVALALWMSR